MARLCKFFVNLRLKNEKMKKLLAIVNPKSGTHDQTSVPATITQVVDSSRFSVDFRHITAPGDAECFAREAVQGGYYGVIAVGGDGTINGAARGLIGTDVALAVVPCGSGNGLARHLGIPLKLQDAIAVVNHDDVQPIDYGTLCGQPFLCTCGVGLDAQVAYRFQQAGRRGFVPYVASCLSEYLTYKPGTFTVSIDGHEFTTKALDITCCNTAQFGFDSFIAPHASAQDGVLDVTIVSPLPVIGAPIVGLSLFTRNIDKQHWVHISRGKHITITRHQDGPMHIDGDPVTMPLTVQVDCHHAGVRIFLPAASGSWQL